MKQRVNVKFCVRIGKSATETYGLLKKVYGHECLSHTQIFKWFNRFKEEREEIRYDQCPSHPSTSKTDANIKQKLVKLFHKITVWTFEQLLSSLTSTRKLFDRFYITIWNGKSVFEDGAETPHSWTKGNSNERSCWLSLKTLKKRKLFRELITCDGSWLFQYHPESKRYFSMWVLE
jgi:hypothetical protein